MIIWKSKLMIILLVLIGDISYNAVNSLEFKNFKEEQRKETEKIKEEGKYSVEDSIELNNINVYIEGLVYSDEEKYFSIYENDTYVLLDSRVPGYIDNSIKFNLYGYECLLKISFELDEEYFTEKDFNPVVYYFYEDMQYLLEIPTNVNGNVAEAITTREGIYMLLNKTEQDEVWENVWEKCLNLVI